MKRDQQPTRVERSGLKAGAAAIASDASLRAAGVKKRICTKKGTASIKGRVAPVGDSSKQARLAAARLFKEHDTAGSGFLQPHSTQLWALCAAVVTECFPWLGTEEQRKVQLALPKLVAAGVPSKGVSLQDFTQHFMELRKKLKLRQKASKLLASAKQQEEEGRLEAAGKSYRACLALAPRNADAHLGYALLLHSSVADKVP